jgi:amino acid adenylation domain-containing protein
MTTRTDKKHLFQLRIAAEKKTKEKDYWLKKLSGEIVKSSFPTCCKKEGAADQLRDTVSFEFSQELSSGLFKLSSGSDIRLHIILTACLTLLINKYTGLNDIIIGSPIWESDIKQKLINTVLALRNQITDTMTFKELLLEVRKTLIEANENRNYPIEVLADELNMPFKDNGFPLFDAALVVENVHVREYLNHVHPNMIFSLLRENSIIAGHVDYNSSLYDEKGIKGIICHFKSLLENTLANMDVKTVDIEILTEEEKKQLLKDFNDTSESFPREKTIHELFEEQVKRTPDRTASVGAHEIHECEGRKLQCHITYHELNEKANQLSYILQQKGVGPGSIVGIMVERSLGMIIGLLGILKAGGAYLPIDPGYPRERIDYMLADSNAKVLLSELNKVRKWNGELLNIHTPAALQPPLSKGDSLSLQKSPPGRGAQREGWVNPTHLCYVIYTSGSTGKPKGVMTEHRALVNRLNWMQRAYPIGERDVILQKTSFTFDVSVWELFWWGIEGGLLCFLEPGGEKSPKAILETVEKNKITTMHFVPSMLNVFMEYLEGPAEIRKLSSLRQVFSSGEALTVHHVERFKHILDETLQIRLINLYGPTEAAIDVTYFNCEMEDNSELIHIPIGKPIDNIRLFVVSKDMHLQPVGAAGELCISGIGLARGYLNRPELTEEKFERTVFSHSSLVIRLLHNSLKTNDRLYRTGDLARWLPDGNIEFLGRMDHQVKIRGFRIELGEIETRLLNHNKVKEAKVSALRSRGTDEEGELYLCAYIVGEGELSHTGLREYLSRQLPDYMVPTHFVMLGKMPLTNSGKVDAKALPEPGIKGAASGYAAPRDKVEEELAAIWAEVLTINPTVEAVGIDDNFLELGGHSLKATTLVYQVYKKFKVNIEIDDVFSHPTIRELAEKIRGAESREYIEIKAIEEKEYYKMSYAQRRLWVLCQFEEDSTAYNMPAAVIINGPLDVEGFGRALQVLADRHESLRTVFVLVDGDPHQKVIRQLETTLEVIDIRSSDEPAREEKARQIFIEHANRAFDLEHGPLFLFKLVQLEEKTYSLIYNIHHIISDGWSQGNINNELITLYNTFLSGRENPLAPLKLQYKDYSWWHNQLISKGGFSCSQEYWLEKLRDKPNGIELPLDHPRKAIQTFNGGRIPFVIDKEKTRELYQLSLSQDATLFMSLLTLLSIFLYRLTGQQDILTGAPIANRKRPELYPLIGFLVNTLVYRNRVNAAQSFKEMLTAIKQETLTCYEYQDYPFDLLVEQLGLDRDLSQSPLFNVMLAHNNAETGDEQLSLEGVSISTYPHSDDFNMSKFDLIFFMDEMNGQVFTRIEYNSDLFERSTVERMRDNFLALTDDVIARSDSPVSVLHILSETESKQVIEAFNDTHCSFPSLTLQELFEQRVEACRDKTAVVSQEHHGWSLDGGAMHITYNELNKKANQLAHYLKDQCGIKPNDAIGVSMERSIDMIAVLLGIIKAGAAYLAVDPTYPQERVLHVLSDSQSDFLVIDKMRPELFGGYQGQIINVQRQWDIISQKSTDNPPAVNQSPDILYINYTSGSTGTPNGAMLSHDCLTNLINWQNENTLINGSLSCLQFTSINFCVSFQEIMGTLTSGGQLHLIGDLERQDIDYLMDYLSRHQVELLFLPFSYLNFLFNESGRWHHLFTHNLKHITTAGEQLKITAGLKRFLDLNPGLKLHNHYGSTEMHVVTSYTLDASTAEKIPIPPAGKPISNVSIYILDEHLNPVPVGVWGELFVKGSSEVLGYINNKDLTGKKLVYHPEFSLENNRLYRSGDIGRWLPDGNIELRGRKDFLVKVRGFRIELGEIESKILSIDRVRECVVVVKENSKGEKTLFAYVSVDNIGAAEIKKIISNDLPQYMVPQVIILDSLPLMPNGKVDREGLPEPESDVDREYVPPRDELEKKLVEIWSEVLLERQKSYGSSTPIGIDDNFFELGGHSLKATLIVSGIHKKLNKKIPLAEMFKTPTIRELADYLRPADQGQYTPIKVLEEKEYHDISPSQGRLWTVSQIEGASLSYNMIGAYLLEGDVDKDALSKVFDTLVQRHEALRTVFVTINEELKQRILPPEEIGKNVEYIDLSKTTTRESKTRELVETLVQRSFNLEKGPLLRVNLIQLEGKKYVFLYGMHHIISDGTSTEVFLNEMLLLYDRYWQGKESPLKPLRIHYKDYTAWQLERLRGEQLKKAETYWLSQLEGELPQLKMPFDKERPEVMEYNGDVVSFHIDDELTGEIRTLGKKNDATLFMTMLAALKILFYKYTGQKDIIVGTPVSGREHADLAGQIGFYLNTLALRTRFGQEETYTALLSKVKNTALEAYEHQLYPFDRLIEQLGLKRDIRRHPIFDVMVDMVNLDISQGGVFQGSLKITSFDCGTRKSKFDLTIYIFEGKDSLDLNFEFSTDLFERATITQMGERFGILLDSIIKNPDVSIENLEWEEELEFLTINPIIN